MTPEAPVTPEPLEGEDSTDDLSVERMELLESIERREEELGDIDPTTDDEFMGYQQRLAEVDAELEVAEGGDVEMSQDVPAARGPIDSTDLDVQPGTQMGSMPGGVAVSKSNGKRYYVKRYENREQVRNEKVANAFYRAAGIRVPETTYVVENGSVVGVASEMIDGLTEDGNPNDAGAGFIMDSWLANWDVVGMDGDNLMTDADGNAVRIDQGGALTTRAQGEPKGSRFGNEVTETTRLREKNEIFSRVSPANMRKGLDSLESISEQDIVSIVAENSTGDAASDSQLIETLIARRKDLLSKRESLVESADAEFSEDVDAVEADAEMAALNVDGRKFEPLSDEDVSPEERKLAERVREKTGKRVKFVRQISGPVTNGWFHGSDPNTLVVVSREYDASAIAQTLGSDQIAKLEAELDKVERAIKRGGESTTTETVGKDGKTTKKTSRSKKRLKDRRSRIKAEIKRRKKITDRTVNEAYEAMLLQTVIHENYHSIDPTSPESDEDRELRDVTHKLLMSVLESNGLRRRLYMPVVTYRAEIAAATTNDEVNAAEEKLNRELRAEAVSDMALLQTSGVIAAFYDRGLMSKVRSKIRRLSKVFGSSKDTQTLQRIMMNTDGNFRLGSYPGALSARSIVNMAADELEDISDFAPLPRFTAPPLTPGGLRPGIPIPMGMEFSIDTPFPYRDLTLKSPEYSNPSNHKFEFDIESGLKVVVDISGAGKSDGLYGLAFTVVGNNPVTMSMGYMGRKKRRQGRTLDPPRPYRSCKSLPCQQSKTKLCRSLD